MDYHFSYHNDGTKSQCFCIRKFDHDDIDRGVPIVEPSKEDTPVGIMRYFTYKHLSQNHLKEVSKMFASLALSIDGILPEGEEKQVALRKLLEAKDAAVRSALSLPASDAGRSEIDVNQPVTNVPEHNV